jgi:hypothetical protein
MRLDMNTEDYFAIADSERSYPEKLAAYEALADAFFDTERFAEFRATQLAHLDAVMWELAQAQEFDAMLVHNVRLIFPPHEQEQFIEHFRGRIRAWVQAEAQQA